MYLSLLDLTNGIVLLTLALFLWRLMVVLTLNVLLLRHGWGVSKLLAEALHLSGRDEVLHTFDGNVDGNTLTKVIPSVVLVKDAQHPLASN
jgi:hypothetical protein